MKGAVTVKTHPERCRLVGTSAAAKRAADIVLSATALVLLAPFLLLIALAIRLDSPGAVLFRQQRVGRFGRHFQILKFRTMLAGTPDLPTDQMLRLPSSITPVGRFLRATSLDELPQLINILRGEMSLVGPRPALYNQLELTACRDDLGVLLFPPGITGWAQINGRDELPDKTKVELDAWYCDHWSPSLDCKIILWTVLAVANRRGAF